MTEWKTIPSFPQYEASSDGDIRRTKTGRVLKQHFDGKLYMRVAVYLNGDPKWRGVHRLVADAFLPPLKGKPQVLHGPNGPLDNSLGNLSRGDASQNHGADKSRDGTLGAKLLPEEIPYIRWLAGFIKQETIGDIFGVTPHNISQIVHRKRWAFIP